MELICANVKRGPGRNSPVLNFSDRLPNPLTDRFTTVNGNQPEIFLFAPPYYHSSFFCSNQPNPRSTSSPGLSPEKNQIDGEKPWGRG